MELSVRFFKRLFLGVLIAMILIPNIVAIFLGVSLNKTKAAAAEQQVQLQRTQEQLSALLASESIGSVYAPPVEGAQPGDPGVLGTAEALPYQNLFPELYSTASVSGERVKMENTIYLTFDDGPSVNTRAILDALDQAEVKATFFVTATELSEKDAATLLCEIRDRGHTIGIHSYCHEYLDIYQSVEAYLTDFNRMYQMIYEATGVKVEIFRFPGGSINSYNSGIYQSLIGEMLRRGFVFFDWNATGGDNLKGADADSILRTVKADTVGKSRNIILLHDTNEKKSVVDALPGVIDHLKQQGYQFQPLTPAVLPIVFSYNSQT